jgi:hypothetical protein
VIAMSIKAPLNCFPFSYRKSSDLLLSYTLRAGKLSIHMVSMNAISGTMLSMAPSLSSFSLVTRVHRKATFSLNHIIKRKQLIQFMRRGDTATQADRH